MSELGKETWTVKGAANFCKTRQKNNLDYTILVTGKKGSGKSTLTIKVAKEICEFTYPKNLIASPNPKVIADTIEAAGVDPAVILDEAIGSLYRENWAKEAQKALHQYFNIHQRRNKRAIIFMCIPNIHDLRGPLIRSSVDMWIHIYAKGKAVVMLPSPFPEEEPFRVSEISKRRVKIGRREGITKTYQEYNSKYQEKVWTSLSTFAAFLRWKELTKAEYSEYLAFTESFRVQHKNELFKTENNNPSKVNNSMNGGGGGVCVPEEKIKLAVCGCKWRDGERIFTCKSHGGLSG
jgi:hypothetical protein